MSSALAIAGVTAVLRDLLNDGMINNNVSSATGNVVTVSAMPPDRVMTNGSESTQLNLFLYQVTFNSGWRNQELPSRDGSGRHRLTNPPLAVDLHYLLSAYSPKELGGEILLGYAMQILYETPMLDRKAIRRALDPSLTGDLSLPDELKALADCGLADQVEQIRLVPEQLSTEDLSKLWTATQSHYRPTAAYLATVVLIESKQPIKATLPVLTRGPVDPVTKRELVVQADLLPRFPAIQSVTPVDGQPAATAGVQVEITGHQLDGTDRKVILTNARRESVHEVEALGDSPTGLRFVMPSVPVGLYQIAVRVVRSGEDEPRVSNQLGLVLGPEITTTLPMMVTRVGTTATLTVTCRPDVKVDQQVSLLLGPREVFSGPRSADTGTLTFEVKQAPVGEHLVRLRVDGIDSPIINRTMVPPEFLNKRITIR